MAQIDFETIKATAMAQRLEEIRAKVQEELGDEYRNTVSEYYKTIRSLMRRRRQSCLAVASSVGKQLQDEGGNPIVFIAACVQFGLDNPNE